MRLVIEIELRNEAMQSAAEAGYATNAALIRQAASALDSLGLHETGTIRDANGNSVGKWEVVEGDSD